MGRKKTREGNQAAKGKIIGKRRRGFLLLMKRIMAAVTLGCFAAVAANSYIAVQEGEVSHSFLISPLEQKEVFEETRIFEELLRKDVRNITRMAVIKSQVEADGAYDGKKKIDITAYVNRTAMAAGEENAENTATVEYFLDDLVRWGDYGFSYHTVFGTLDDFLWYFQTGSARENNTAEEQAAALSDDISLEMELLRQEVKRSKQAAGTDNLSMKMISEMPDSVEACVRRAEEMGYSLSQEMIYQVDILVPRYYSASGADLADYAGNLWEYIELRNILVDAGNQLYQNFTEYGSFKDQYSADKNNVRYAYQMVVNGEVCFFTNVDMEQTVRSEEEITSVFQNYGRHLYYNPDRFEVKTNTDLSSEELRSILGAYEYAFEEGSRVWLGVDTAYTANDMLAQARNAFVRFMPFYWEVVAIGTAAAILYLWLLVRLTTYEGRVPAENEDGYIVRLRKGDVFPSEFVTLFMLAMPASIVGLWMVGADLFLSDGNEFLQNRPDPFILAAAIAVAAFVADWIGTVFYLSAVRRLKLQVFCRNTIFWKVCVIIRRLVIQLYENTNIIVRILIPFLGIAALNLLMGMIGPVGIMIAGMVDILFAIILYVDRKALKRVVDGTLNIGDGDFEFKIDTASLYGENLMLAEAVNRIGDGIQEAVATSMKDERLKADLITNVSHDIKTPLTSIINFVNLLKREEMPNEKARGYIEVLESKAQRLRQLTDDLVEASKISSGNITLDMEKINFRELINQTIGEFSEKMQEKCLQAMASMPEQPVYIEADSRRIWRVVENLFGNVCKYALEGTRVYLDLEVREIGGRKMAVFAMKNISAQSLNIRAEELTERFIRGDVSRSTEGSGLGLSIARNLTELQNGKFDIYLDGDLFKVILMFPCLEEPDRKELGLKESGLEEHALGQQEKLLLP